MPQDSIWYSMMRERALELVAKGGLTAAQIAERTGLSRDNVVAMQNRLKKRAA